MFSRFMINMHISSTYIFLYLSSFNERDQTSLVTDEQMTMNALFRRMLKEVVIAKCKILLDDLPVRSLKKQAKSHKYLHLTQKFTNRY